MLDMGFVNDEKIVKLTPKQTNTFFSATMPIAIRTG
jgi:superfamily II DNA/RNA helicase